MTNAVLANDELKEQAAELAPKVAYSPEFLFALVRIYATVLARWGGGGRDDITEGSQWENPLRNRESEDRRAQATAIADPLTRTLLNVLCFSTSVVETSWALTQSDRGVIDDLYTVIDASKR